MLEQGLDEVDRMVPADTPPITSPCSPPGVGDHDNVEDVDEADKASIASSITSSTVAAGGPQGQVPMGHRGQIQSGGKEHPLGTKDNNQSGGARSTSASA
jgi:hypothetical protein